MKSTIINNTAVLARQVTLAAALGTIAVLASPIMAHSASDSTPSVPKCATGQVYSPKYKKCVKRTSNLINDDDRYNTSVQLARSGKYVAAIDLLGTIANQNDPRVLTYLGYSNRKMGQMNIGVAYYKKALDIDPDYILAREYLGEGYVAQGKIVLAFLQLKEIENRCGTSCREYGLLKQAISTSKTIY